MLKRSQIFLILIIVKFLIFVLSIYLNLNKNLSIAHARGLYKLFFGTYEIYTETLF